MTRLRAFWRAFRGRCAECNSDPTRTCEICRPFMGQPFDRGRKIADWLVCVWLSRYFEAILDREEKENAKRAADRLNANFGEFIDREREPREFGVTCLGRQPVLHDLPPADPRWERPTADGDMLGEMQEPARRDPREAAGESEMLSLPQTLDAGRARRVSPVESIERGPQAWRDKDSR